MNILMTGGTGLIGKALTRSFLADGRHVWILTRTGAVPPPTGGLTYVYWDGSTPSGWGNLVSQMDVVINLAGESLTHWPWTEKQKITFLNSRVRAGQALTEAIRAASPRPQVLIQASGINHYGLRGNTADEATPPGDDFLSRLTVSWEDASREAESLGVRRCVVRLAVVLAPKGGLFPLIAMPVNFFIGGPQGSGSQVLPWIHLVDVVNAIRFLVDHQDASGPYNLVAPEIVTNAYFNSALAKAKHRPYWFPTPAFFLKWMLGGMSVLILEGRAVSPARLLKEGYQFRFTTLDAALKQLT
jgi:uncharacterized protein